MKRPCRTLVVVGGLLFGCTGIVLAQESQKPSIGGGDPYSRLAGRLQSELRFVTDVAFPGGPSFQVKIYDWVMGPRQEFPEFPLEGLATIEVKAGEVETTINGLTAVYHEGQYFVVPAGARLTMKIRPETGRGDNIVSLHAVVVIRR